MKDIDHYFSYNYDDSRQKFRDLFSTVKEKWPQASMTSHPIGEENDNTIDVIYAESVVANEQLIFLTSGLHGIEGYVGAAIINMFVADFLNKIDERKVGVCLVHAINPWGMRNFRRVTENNVDLNRNCFYDNPVASDINQNYRKTNQLFNPPGEVLSIAKEKFLLYIRLFRSLFKIGLANVEKAKKMGQYEFKKGVYFGAINEEPSTKYLKKLQKRTLENFNVVIHLDFHSGMGPSKEATIVVSEHEQWSEDQLKDKFSLKNVMKFTEEEVKGDSTNHFYLLKKKEFNNKKLFSALCEFGTYGTGKKALLRELKTMVFENKIYWYGSDENKCKKWIEREYLAMFYPNDNGWRKSVIEEGKKIISRVLEDERIFN